MEEGVNDINYEEKNKGEKTDSEITTMDEGKGVNNEKGRKDVDLDELDESTCSDDTYMIFMITRNKLLQKILLFV